MKKLLFYLDVFKMKTGATLISSVVERERERGAGAGHFLKEEAGAGSGAEKF